VRVEKQDDLGVKRKSCVQSPELIRMATSPSKIRSPQAHERHSNSWRGLLQRRKRGGEWTRAAILQAAIFSSPRPRANTDEGSRRAANPHAAGPQVACCRAAAPILMWSGLVFLGRMLLLE
jgi:hypothetical protein